MHRRQLLAERARLTGKERVDTTPVELPLNARPQTMEDRLKAFIRQQISSNAQEQGLASFEEEDDFDLPEEDDEFPQPFAVRDMQPLAEPNVPLETIEGDAQTPLDEEPTAEPPPLNDPSGSDS